VDEQLPDRCRYAGDQSCQREVLQDGLDLDAHDAGRHGQVLLQRDTPRKRDDMNLRSEGTNPRALGTNPRRKTKPVIPLPNWDNQEKVRAWLLLTRRKPRVRKKPDRLIKQEWQSALRMVAAGTEAKIG
jgi:hypothetical protein